MREFKIKTQKTGNCDCGWCCKEQPGRQLHPYTVWWKDDFEKRGHNEPMCSLECCQNYIEHYNKVCNTNYVIKGGK